MTHRGRGAGGWAPASPAFSSPFFGRPRLPKTTVWSRCWMNDLVRPTLYDAHHDIRPVHEPAAGGPRIDRDIVGPVCESGDSIALDRSLVAPQPSEPPRHHGSAGAYSAVQVGTYNSRALVPEVLVRADESGGAGAGRASRPQG